VIECETRTGQPPLAKPPYQDTMPPADPLSSLLLSSAARSVRTARHTAACMAVLIGTVQAQTPSGAPESRPSAPAAAAAAASAPTTRPAPPAGQPTDLQRVQITGSTAADGDTLQRQQSTAAKIIVGREEIDRYGDSNLGDVLKRLPGVTLGGPPGRGGGGPRMRGLSGGYTQLLINGEPIPAGFSLESLTPEQVERIEILRAPTAEFGARAIAGTINIVLREALQKRLNDLRVGFTVENGQWSPGVSWTRNDKLGDRPGSAYNLSVSAFRRTREDQTDNRSSLTDIASGVVRQQQFETGDGRDQREGLNISGRLQWRLGEGESLTLQPFLFVSRSDSTGTRRLDQPFGLTPAPYASADTSADSRFAVARTNLQWQKRLGSDTRLELRGSAGGFSSASHSLRHEFDATGAPSRTLDDDSTTRERSWTSVGKLSKDLANDHALVTGWDLEGISRNEQRTTLQDGRSLLAGFGNELSASSRRIALYAQDEWNPTKQWSAYAGLRWERIATKSDDATNPVSRQSAVWTPLLQAVWKPSEKSRDQVRMALTRSYKSPTLRNLIARPNLSTRYPVPGDNLASSPDTVGNPALRPELATGLDLAYEHYLSAGGLVSVNLFHRQISDLIRNVTSLQTVSWAPVPRWVSQPRNIGDAVTQGVELEAKGRLSEFVSDWPAVQVRSNLSLFRSRVEGVPGPDNRLDEQPAATANLGADYRFRGLPLMVGANLNWTPAYDTQQTENQRRSVSTKRSFEAFATWTFSPAVQLRVGATDLAPLDYITASSIDTGPLRDASETRNTTRTQWSLRLELKL
jgi:outer membrane receptor for ferrienterochelin and colicins